MRDFFGDVLEDAALVGKRPLKEFRCPLTWVSFSTDMIISRFRLSVLSVCSSRSMEEARDSREVTVEGAAWRCTARSRKGRVESPEWEGVALSSASASSAASFMISRCDSRASTRNMLSCVVLKIQASCLLRLLSYTNYWVCSGFLYTYILKSSNNLCTYLFSISLIERLFKYVVVSVWELQYVHV